MFVICWTRRTRVTCEFVSILCSVRTWKISRNWLLLPSLTSTTWLMKETKQGQQLTLEIPEGSNWTLSVVSNFLQNPPEFFGKNIKPLLGVNPTQSCGGNTKSPIQDSHGFRFKNLFTFIFWNNFSYFCYFHIILLSDSTISLWVWTETA